MVINHLFEFSLLLQKLNRNWDIMKWNFTQVAIKHRVIEFYHILFCREYRCRRKLPDSGYNSFKVADIILVMVAEIQMMRKLVMTFDIADERCRVGNTGYKDDGIRNRSRCAP